MGWKRYYSLSGMNYAIITFIWREKGTVIGTGILRSFLSAWEGSAIAAPFRQREDCPCVTSFNVNDAARNIREKDASTRRFIDAADAEGD